MQIQLKKWGNSFAIRIPKETIDRLGLEENAKLYLFEDKESITIKKDEPYLLDTMLENYTGRHKEVDWGESVGKEFW